MRDEFKSLTNWHNRGYMPHYDAHGKYQMITYRLADSLPQKILKEIIDKYPENETIQRRREIELQIDKGYGSCLLKHPRCAEIIIENWKYFDQKRYDLISYVVMPNHVHLLIKTHKIEVGYLVKSWKIFTAKAIRKYYASMSNADYQSALPEHSILQSGTPFWQREYWDRFIRDEIHFNYAVSYIHENPVKAGLVKNSHEWPYSSLNGK
ncbi:MAG: transposase [Lentisphaeraceae bacterium]|nr:transposase [Lentisphaeraceae bacterium]